MAGTDEEPQFIGLSEFLASLVRETGEAVHRAQLEQSENESDLKAAASLEIEAAAEKLVTSEAVQMLQERLMTESGADAAWATRYTNFLHLVEERLGLALTPTRDYTKRGLTAAGHTKILAAARRSIAAEQLQIVHRLLGEGTHRVKIASGMISVKLEMRAHQPRTDAAPSTKKTTKANTLRQEPPLASKFLDSIGRDDLRIIVRPAQREDGEVAGIFGEITINFVVV